MFKAKRGSEENKAIKGRVKKPGKLKTINHRSEKESAIIDIFRKAKSSGKAHGLLEI